MIHLYGKNTNTKIHNVVDVDVQPNAIDLRLGDVYRLKSTTFTINEREKNHRLIEKIEPYSLGSYLLNSGCCYQVSFENTIQVGEDECGWVITRSTLVRNGVFLVSGLYDSGYEGKMIAALHVTSGDMIIERGTRIGQFLIFKSESVKQYQGDYGFNTTHDKKYT